MAKTVKSQKNTWVVVDKNMIGDLEITSPNSRILYIPLQFWFCRNIGLSLPLISINNSEIKINIELEDNEELDKLIDNVLIKLNKKLQKITKIYKSNL